MPYALVASPDHATLRYAPRSRASILTAAAGEIVLDADQAEEHGETGSLPAE
jgi:hypothetical protein